MLRASYAALIWVSSVGLQHPLAAYAGDEQKVRFLLNFAGGSANRKCHATSWWVSNESTYPLKTSDSIPKIEQYGFHMSLLTYVSSVSLLLIEILFEILFDSFKMPLFLELHVTILLDIRTILFGMMNPSVVLLLIIAYVLFHWTP